MNYQLDSTLPLLSRERSEGREALRSKERDRRIDQVQIQVVASTKHQIVLMRLGETANIANGVLMARVLACVDDRTPRRVLVRATIQCANVESFMDEPQARPRVLK
jgi:hypothetical protein